MDKQAGPGIYYGLILERLDKAKKENKQLELGINVLLMNPKSNTAKFRMKVEKKTIPIEAFQITSAHMSNSYV